MKRFIIVITFFTLFYAPQVLWGDIVSAPSINVGEHHSYHIKWLGINVGTLDVVVREEAILDGKEVYVIAMSGGTNRFCSMIYRIRDSFVSYIDKETLRPLKLEVSRREGFYEKDAITIFNHEKGIAYFHNFLDGSSKEYAIPADVQDIVSVFYRLRYDRVILNRKLTYNVAFAETVFFTYGAAEARDNFEITEGKIIPAYVSYPRAKVGTKEVKDGSVEALFSADDYKVPLKVTLKTPLFTQLTMTLTEATFIK